MHWRASAVGARRAHTSLRAALSALRSSTPSPPPVLPPPVLPSAAAPAPSQAAITTALIGSILSTTDAKKADQTLEHARATERVKAVEASDSATKGLAALHAGIESTGEDYEAFLELHSSITQQNPALAALLKTTKIPKPSGAQDTLGLLGMGGVDAGKAERIAAIVKAASYVQEHVVHAISEDTVMPRLGADGACQRLAKAAYQGQLASLSITNGTFKLDELGSDNTSQLVPGKDGDAKALMDKSTELLSLVLSIAHPTDSTIQSTFADVSSKATGTSGKGKDHNLVYGALFRSYAALWDRFQHTQAAYPTLRDAWKRALTSDRVREAGSIAAEQTQSMVSKLASLEAADAARTKELDSLRTQLSSLKTSAARQQPKLTQPPPAGASPPAESGNKIFGAARKKLQTEKSELYKALGAKRRALEAAADAEKPPIQTELDSLLKKLNDLTAKLAEKA